MMKRFLASESGATAIEYAFIALLISIAAVAVIMSIGEDVEGKFQDTADSFPSSPN